MNGWIDEKKLFTSKLLITVDKICQIHPFETRVFELLHSTVTRVNKDLCEKQRATSEWHLWVEAHVVVEDQRRMARLV